MIKTNFDIKKIKKDIEDKFTRELTSKQFKNKLGEEITSMIYKRTKSGKSLSAKEGGGTSPLKPLSVGYKKFRKKYKDYLLGEYASVNKSNLTFSGQMLDALKYKLQGDKIVVYIDNTTRKPTIPGRKEKIPTNSGVAEDVSKKRPFLGITEGETRIIGRTITDAAKALFKKIKGGF